MTSATISPDTTLAELATTRSGATRVFHRHGLDFCCHGDATLVESCASRGLDVAALVDEIEREDAGADSFERWDDAPLGRLVGHILDDFHARHREELPRLLELARKVERVHAGRPQCPVGLADHLARMAEALELHMLKEEEILFPMILGGHGRLAAVPVSMMEREHEDHARNLDRLRELAHDYAAPPHACATWRALYLGLAELERDLMEHVHLENHVLFPRALRGA